MDRDHSLTTNLGHFSGLGKIFTETRHDTRPTEPRPSKNFLRTIALQISKIDFSGAKFYCKTTKIPKFWRYRTAPKFKCKSKFLALVVNCLWKIWSKMTKKLHFFFAKVSVPAAGPDPVSRSPSGRLGNWSRSPLSVSVQDQECSARSSAYRTVPYLEELGKLPLPLTKNSPHRVKKIFRLFAKFWKIFRSTKLSFLSKNTSKLLVNIVFCKKLERFAPNYRSFLQFFDISRQKRHCTFVLVGNFIFRGHLSW